MLLMGAYGHQYWTDNKTLRRGEADAEVGREGQRVHRGDKASADDYAGTRSALLRERPTNKPRGYYA